MQEYITTYRDGIKITDLQRGDLLYVKKMQNGFDRQLQCKFMRIKKGIVEAEVIKIWTECKWKEPAEYDRHFFKDGNLEAGIITTRPSCCFLWGRGKKDKDDYCHWFK